MSRVTVIVVAFLALFVAGCGGDGDDGSGGARDPAPQAGATEEATTGGGQEGASTKGDGRDEGGGGSTQPGITIRSADSQFGTILFDEDDQAIYLFDKEQTETSECYGECAAAWPPVLIDGDPEAGGGADAKLLGTTRRDDGKTQVTYNGHPLYYYVDDPPGQVLCHDVVEFGGLWLVVDPRGDAVQ